MLSGYTGDFIVVGSTFAVAMGMDVIMKDACRMKIDEIAIYKVKTEKL